MRQNKPRRKQKTLDVLRGCPFFKTNVKINIPYKSYDKVNLDLKKFHQQAADWHRWFWLYYRFTLVFIMRQFRGSSASRPADTHTGQSRRESPCCSRPFRPSLTHKHVRAHNKKKKLSSASHTKKNIYPNHFPLLLSSVFQVVRASHPSTVSFFSSTFFALFQQKFRIFFKGILH